MLGGTSEAGIFNVLQACSAAQEIGRTPRCLSLPPLEAKYKAVCKISH